MSITLSWEDEAQTIIRQDLIGQWTWAEFRQTTTRMIALIEQTDHPVDAIFNLLDSMPVNQLEVITHGRWAINLWPRKAATYGVVVTNSPLLHAAVTLLRLMLPEKAGDLYHTSTVEEARSLIASKRAGSD